MNFNQAVPLFERNKFSEGTGLASKRDSRNLPQQWKVGRNQGRQQYGLVQAIEKISREVAKQKRRIVGGGGAATASQVVRGEYDPTLTYTQGQIVIVSTGSNAGTYFVTAANVTGVAPWTGAPNWAQFPQGLLGAWM